MNVRTLLFIFSTSAGIACQSCKRDKPGAPANDLKVPAVETVLKGNDLQLISLLHNVRGSVGTRGPGSKTIWSRKNDYGLGLYISANHVYNISGWDSRNAQFIDLATVNPGIFETSQIPPANGQVALGTSQIADFPLMHFDIASGATNTTILPAEDFYIGVIDNQRAEQGPFPKHPEPVKTGTPLDMYDPANRTKAGQTWSAPVAGEKAIAVGYPRDRTAYPNGAVAYGKILSDAEAAQVMQQLKSAGDAEGDVPYNAAAEFFVEAQAIAGMSGGGVFNAAGQLLGVMVRASDHAQAPRIIRVVKMSHIRAKLTAYYNSLPEAAKGKVRPFISGELQ